MQQCLEVELLIDYGKFVKMIMIKPKKNISIAKIAYWVLFYITNFFQITSNIISVLKIRENGYGKTKRKYFNCKNCLLM